MKIKVGTLRQLVAEAGAKKIAAAPSYIKKEKVREQLQKMIADAIASGEITDQTGLADYVATVNMAMSALKMVPFEAFASMSTPVKRPVSAKPRCPACKAAGSPGTDVFKDRRGWWCNVCGAGLD